MVLCIIALPVFAVLGIFSLKFRKLAKESLECLFRTATLRKCRSGLDDRIKSSFTGKIMKISPKTASFVYRNFRIISFLILALFLWSTYSSAAGVYNYAKYGSCDGPSEDGFCVLDPAGANTKTSGLDMDFNGQVILPSLENDDPIIGNKNAQITIIEFGCYACPYTKKAEPIVKEVLDYYDGKVNLQFKTAVIPHHNTSYMTALAANCAMEQGKYDEYHALLFENQKNITKELIYELAGNAGIGNGQFIECIRSEKYRQEIESDTLQGYNAGITGTPTFFINGQRITGPKPFRAFKTIINAELKK